MAHCVYCIGPEGECSKVRNALLKACSKWFTKNSLPENARVVWIVECVGCGLQTCSWYLALSRRRMAKSSKLSRRKSNSLPPANLISPWWMTISMSYSAVSVRRMSFVTPFNAWAAVMAHCTGPVFEELHKFHRFCVHFKTAWKTWLFYIDLQCEPFQTGPAQGTPSLSINTSVNW